ncbi:DNA topoisomerase IB [Ferruginibacter sp.]
METAATVINIPRRKIKAISKDPEKTAAAVHLVYVHDTQPGIKRIRKGKGFSYTLHNKTVTDKATLQRIKSLVIPPAWENVWICLLENGHLQITGMDVRKRKQYKYHPLWNSLRNHTKFYRLLEFAKVLPAIRQQLEKDLALQGLPVEKVLALITSLMERTHIRVGNNFYEKLYGSFGLTTLKNRHVAVNGTRLQFIFKGKKGIEHNITLKSKRLARLVKQCMDIPGKELFQYYNETGERKPVDSGMVNDYIKKISGGDFSAKDFRTWAGTLDAFLAFKELGLPGNKKEEKKKTLEMLDTVAQHLGNSRNVCKKYYVHPAVLSIYENKSAAKYLDDTATVPHEKTTLTPEEQKLVHLLEAS